MRRCAESVALERYSPMSLTPRADSRKLVSAGGRREGTDVIRPHSLGALPLAVALLFIAPPGRSLATTETGVNSTTVNQTSQDGRDFIISESTIDPGGSTGWHYHDGTVVVAVKHGTLTHYAADCSVDGVHNPGDTFIEPVGPDHVHIARNLGAIPVMLEVMYVLPAGKPLHEDAPNPGCPFG
jgi:quercetin dioxygenase-like cupin family protein